MVPMLSGFHISWEGIVVKICFESTDSKLVWSGRSGIRAFQKELIIQLVKNDD